MYTKIALLTTLTLLVLTGCAEKDNSTITPPTPQLKSEVLPPSVDGAEMVWRTQDTPTGSDAPSDATGSIDAQIIGPVAP